jgi:hypothetical protein
LEDWVITGKIWSAAANFYQGRDNGVVASKCGFKKKSCLKKNRAIKALL